MKKRVLIGATLFLGMMLVAVPAEAQTRKQKKAAKQAEWEFQQKKAEMERQRVLDSIQNANARPATSPAGTRFDMPCLSAGRSDKEYFRQLGFSDDMDLAVAQKNAVRNAKTIIRDRLGEQVKGLSTDYAKQYSKSGKGDDMQGIIEREFISVVDDVLNSADNPCEDATQLNTGAYRYYYVVEIRKGELLDKVDKKLSKNDKLEADFNRDQFRKYAEEYFNKQQAFQNDNQ